MTTIRSVQTVIVDVPLVRTHKLAMAVMQAQSSVIVVVTSEDGRVGVGEATTIRGAAYVPESPESIKAVIDAHIAPLMIGQDVSGPRAVMGRISSAVVGNNFAKCAVETALWDLYGKTLGLPISALFGGAVRKTLPVLWTLASGDVERDIEEAETLIEARRHNVFKVKIGRASLAEDCESLARLAQHFGERARFRVDVNQGWSLLEAQQGCARLADAGVDLVEQPISRDDISGLSLLTQRGNIAIMADEAINGPVRMAEVIQARAGHAVSIKIAQAGGLLAARSMIDLALLSNMGLYGGTMLEGAVGTAASAQLFSTVEHFAWDTELFGPLLQRETLAITPLVYRDFQLEVPQGPGLGVGLDWSKVKRYGRDGQPDLDIPADAREEVLHAVHG
ncbi:MAG: muconate cycloisomerase family protein [Pseudomonadota bacterium]